MKLTKLQQIFADLQLKITKDIFDKYDKVIYLIAKLQKENKKIILDKIANILLENEIIDNKLNISVFKKIKLKQECNKFLKEVFKSEYEEENKTITDNLINLASDKYYSNSYLYSLGINYNLKQVSDKTLKEIINKKIKGENYSSRIWTNKNKVAKQLQVEINQFLDGKTDVNSINNRINKRFNVNWNNSSRLVRTETAKVQAEANEKWCEDHNIKSQLFMATLDSKTSKLCQSYDGKVFDIDDSSKPIPPLHPNCRSTLINIVNKDWRPKFRLDNNTKKKIDYVSYKEWKEQNLN